MVSLFAPLILHVMSLAYSNKLADLASSKQFAKHGFGIPYNRFQKCFWLDFSNQPTLYFANCLATHMVTWPCSIWHMIHVTWHLTHKTFDSDASYYVSLVSKLKVRYHSMPMLLLQLPFCETSGTCQAFLPMQCLHGLSLSTLPVPRRVKWWQPCLWYTSEPRCKKTSSGPSISECSKSSPALNVGFLQICSEPLQVQHRRSPTPTAEGLRQKHGSEAFSKNQLKQRVKQQATKNKFKSKEKPKPIKSQSPSMRSMSMALRVSKLLAVSLDFRRDILFGDFCLCSADLLALAALAFTANHSTASNKRCWVPDETFWLTLWLYAFPFLLS